MGILNRNLWLISIRQSFLHLLPYFIFIGVTILFHQLFESFNFKDNIFYIVISKIISLYSFSTPLIISISISYFLAKNFDLDKATIPTVNFLIFVFFYWEYKDVNEININLNLNFLMIILPIFATFIYKTIFNLMNFLYELDNINEELKQVLKSIIPFCITFLFCSIFIIFFIEFSKYLTTIIFVNSFSNLPVEVLAILNIFFSGLIWWLTGIHGTNFVIAFFGDDYLKQPIIGNLDANIFVNNFIIYGGDGSTLALILAILFFIKDTIIRKIALISLPFAIFNINEIILFALPIILNPRLLIPFILAPLSNFLIAYLYFYLNPITNIHYSISWITPIFLSGYYVEQNLTYVYLQLIQLTIAIFIYLPFIKSYEKSLCKNEHFNNLKNSLGINDYVEKTLHLNFIKTQQDIINEEKETARLVKELSSGNLLLYYQPKVNIKDFKVSGYEALLRFKKNDGKITGPYFIDKLEQIGFEKIVDFWLIKQVKQDLENWAKIAFHPKISINISPESICNKIVVQKIIDELKGFKVDIEILERTFAKEMKLFLDNINILKNNGFTISVDDFGSGFSSLQYLNILPVNTIKLDRSLILNTKTLSGKNLYKSISFMCQKQEFELIAEGIETDEELRIAKESNIDIIQGFYFSKALPFNEIEDYEKELKNKLFD